MKLAVAGAGFVGLVHAAVMANQENQVVLFDVNERRIDDLNDFCAGVTDKLPIHEPGLPELIKSAQKKNTLFFTTDADKAIQEATVIFICVGTPPNEQGKADLKYVDSVAHNIGKVLQQSPGYKLIVNKSTVPVGTAKRVRKIVSQYYQGEFDVASNPETLAEGRAVRDASMPTRIIVGVDSTKARKIFHELYARFFLPQQEKIYFMSPESGELTKYACNTYLASQVVLTNIFANTAKQVGANWRDMVPAILDDVRIGKFVHPGPGFGGSCFSKDLAQLYHTIREHGGDEFDYTVLETVLAQNEHQKLKIMHDIEKAYKGDFAGKKIAVWGLSFKRDTNDIRDAASLKLIPHLLNLGCTVHLHDPEAMEEFIKEMEHDHADLTNALFFTDKYEAIKGCDGLLILNDWKTYKQPDFNTLREALQRKVIFDGKDLLEYASVKDEGDFEYYSIGRPDIVNVKP